MKKTFLYKLLCAITALITLVTALPASTLVQAATASIMYRTHCQNYGWMAYSRNGLLSGTTGQGLRVEAFEVMISGLAGDVVYRSHVQNISWQNWVKNGSISGTTGQSLRVEAFEIKLTGEIAKHYDVVYRSHVQNIGWQNWVKNGSTSGTTGQGLQIEAIEIKLVAKSNANNNIVTNLPKRCTITSALSSNLAVDVANNSSNNGTNIQIYTVNGTTAQIFEPVLVKDHWYKLVHVGSNKVIDVSGGVQASGVNVWLYSYNGSDAQLWRFVSVNGGYYIQNKLGYYLDVQNGIAAAGTNVWVHKGNGSKAQIWNINAVTNQTTTVSSNQLHSPVADGAKFKSTQILDNGWKGNHDINVNVSTNTPVYSICDGTAYFYQYHTNGYLRSYGNYIKFIGTYNGDKYEVRYAHLSRFNGVDTPITVSAPFPCSGCANKELKKEVPVSAGQILGWIGKTGNASGVHLHIEIYKNGVRIDPTTLFPNLK